MKVDISQSEHAEQVALFQWANLSKNKYPGLEFMFAIPNGGFRNLIVGLKLKREGVKSGVPDIFLPIARGKYCGLFLELKIGKNKLSKNQENWFLGLRREKYQVLLCYGFEKAKDEIIKYLDTK